MSISPKSITSLQLEIPLRPSIIGYEASMTLKQVTSLEKQNGHCKKYLDERYGYDNCSENFFKEYFVHKINCSIPGQALSLLKSPSSQKFILTGFCRLTY